VIAVERCARRAFVVVIDACGVGALPDSAPYGDEGADTLRHVAELAGGLNVPTLEKLGLGCIAPPLAGVPPAADPVIHGRLHPLGPGKDSACGHRELMGLPAELAPPTYPDGFPPGVIAAIEHRTGRPVLANRALDGLAAIERYGEHAMADGSLIVYTSQDSVLQIAAHADAVSVEELHEACAAVRGLMVGRHAVGRVIARPFAGAPGSLCRCRGRRDFALDPPGPTYLDELVDAGVATHAVGKVGELFNGAGIVAEHRADDNASALAAVDRLIDELEGGLVFANLVETDQVYGHRHDAAGFGAALARIDHAVLGWLGRLDDDDLLVLTADHGCDPVTPGTDHSREYVPLLARVPGQAGTRHDGPMADVGASVLAWCAGRTAPGLPGEPFAGLRAPTGPTVRLPAG